MNVRDGTTGRFEIVACAVALGAAATMVWGGPHGGHFIHWLDVNGFLD
jgi:hypothetical protein